MRPSSKQHDNNEEGTPVCPSCETKPANREYGVCDDCAAMYVNIDPNWQQSEWGRFLVASNLETSQMSERIAHEPTAYDIERVAAPIEEIIVRATKDASLNEMIEALVLRHGWGYRRIHDFLSVGGYSPPSLATIKRRVREVKAHETRPYEERVVCNELMC